MEQKKNGGKTLLIVIIVAVVVILCCGGGCILGIGGFAVLISDSESASPAATPSQTRPTQTAPTLPNTTESESETETESESEIETETEAETETETESETETETETPGGNTTGKSNEEFDKLIDQYLQDYVGENLINLHYTIYDPSYLNITDYDCDFGELNYASIIASLDDEYALYDELCKFDYDTLDEDEKLIFDTIEYYTLLDKNIDAKNFIYYSDPLSSVGGIHSNLPITLSEYDFRNAGDVDEYLQMLTDVPRYFSDVVTFEKEKSAQGLFMSDKRADTVIEDCTSFIEGDPAESILCSSFERRINTLTDLTEEQKQQYIAMNEKYVSSYVFPAFIDLISNIKALKGTGKDIKGVCELPNGQEYYQYVVNTDVGTSATISEIEAQIARHQYSDLLTMSSLYTNETLSEVYSSSTLISLPSDPTEIMVLLQEKSATDFPALKEINYAINDLPKDMEFISSPAFYMIPPIGDQAIENHIYINRSSESFNDISYLFTTMAHEGYPGHLFQTNYFHQNCDDTFRNIINNDGYVEGWATYVEMNSYHWMDGLSENAQTFTMANQSYSLSLYAQMDLNINYYGQSREDFYAFLADNFGGSVDTWREEGDEFYDLIVGEPGNYLVYYVGYINILDLKDEYMRKNPSATTLDFNTWLLDMGPLPFDVLEKNIPSGK